MNRHETFADRTAAEEPGLIGSILRALRNHPIAQEVIANELADREDRRLAIVDQILAAREQSEKTIPKLRQEAQAAQRELAEIEPRYEAIVRKWQAARDSHGLAQHNVRWEEERLLTQVEQLADPEIDHTIAELQNRLAKHFEEQVTISDVRTRKTWGSDVVDYITTTGPSHNRRRIYLLAAIQQAIDLKRELDQSGVRERLAKLIENIPQLKAEIVKAGE